MIDMVALVVIGSAVAFTWVGWTARGIWVDWCAMHEVDPFGDT